MIPVRLSRECASPRQPLLFRCASLGLTAASESHRAKAFLNDNRSVAQSVIDPPVGESQRIDELTVQIISLVGGKVTVHNHLYRFLKKFF